MLRRLFIFLFYSLFSLIVIIVSLIYLFPRDKMLSWSEQFIGRQLPGIECRIGAIKYIHPLKLRLYEVAVRSKRYRVELPIETLLLSFEPRYPLRRVGVVGVLLGGDLKTDLVVSENNLIELRNLDLSELHLADLTMLERMIDRPLRGRLSFSGRAVIDQSRTAGVRINGSLGITEFYTELRRPIFGENEVRFNTLSAELSHQENRLEMSIGKAAGPLLAGTFYGEIRGDRPWEQSTLDITGTLSPQPGLLEKRPDLADQLRAMYQQFRRQSFPYAVDGTLTEPRFRFTELN